MNPRVFTRSGLAAIALIGCAVSVATSGTAAQVRGQASPASNGVEPPTVLFLCPHGAAKSVLASAYFQRLAKERGLDVLVVSAGTEPDAEVAPAVANHLAKKGYEVPVAKPRLVTPDEVAAADVVISIGCDLTGYPTPRGTLLEWDVPSPSADFARADEEIRRRVAELVDELVRKRQVR